MFESKQQCIANCLMIEHGTHVLYRNLGMADVDSASSHMSRRHIKEQISTYFPDVMLNNVSIDTVSGKGKFIYTISFKE